MGSSRLPGKVLARIGTRTAIGHLLVRLARCQSLDEVVIATSTSPADDALADALRPDVIAGALRVCRGSEDDVLARFADAARTAEADVVVRLTGDCPLIDPVEVDRVVQAFLRRRDAGEPLDFLRNQRGATRRIPHGLDVEVMTNAALQQAHTRARAPGQREHVTPWLYADDTPLHIDHTDPPGEDRSHLRLTVDTPEDLTVLRQIVAALGPDVDAAAACDWLDDHPAVRAIQDGLQQRGISSADETRADRIQGRHLLARVDAGDGIGFGHMARVEALATAWTEAGGQATLLGWGLGGPSAARLRAAGVSIQLLAAPAAIAGAGGPDDVADAAAQDARDTLAAAEKLGAAWVLVDGYPFRAAWQTIVSARLPLVSIDDLASFPQVADVVVNQNVGFEAHRYGHAPGGRGRVLAGAPFVLLRTELRRPAATPPRDDRLKAAPPRRILVTFGGADLGGWTVPVTRALLDRMPRDVLIDALIGPGASAAAAAALTELAAATVALAAARPRLTIRHNLATIAPWMDGASLAVCAAGSTCWELLARGVVPVAVPLAANQRAVADGLRRHHAGLVPGWHADINADAVAAAAAGLLADPTRLAQLATAGARLIDGRGVWRVIDAALDAIDVRAALAQRQTAVVESAPD